MSKALDRSINIPILKELLSAPLDILSMGRVEKNHEFYFKKLKKSDFFFKSD